MSIRKPIRPLSPQAAIQPRPPLRKHLLRLHDLLINLEVPLLRGRNRKTVDLQIRADAIDDQERPAEIHDDGEHEVGLQIPQLPAGRHGGQPQDRQVEDDGPADQRPQHHGPVGEGLARQVREDDLGRHAPEDEGHGEAEEDEVVLVHERGVRREQPGADGEREGGHRRPFEEHGQDGQVVAPPREDHIVHAEGDVRREEREDDDAHPDVAEGDCGQGGGEELVAEEVDQRLRPDGWAVVSRCRHDGTGEDETFRRPIDDA